jgi:hypothetical protein
LDEAKFTNNWEVTPYGLVDKCQRVGGRGKKPAATIFRIGNEDSRFL